MSAEAAYATEIDELDLSAPMPTPAPVPAVRSPRQAPARRATARSSAKSDAGSILGAIMQAASNPQIDADKVERLMKMYREIVADEAKRAYLAAFPAMQAELPVVNQNGQIEIREKGTAKVIQSTRYAKWEDINEAIQPVLGKHGFGLSFRLSVAADGKQNVTAVVSHNEGHQEETTITLMHDSTGSKNSVQAVGSTISYGQRYSARALLNFQSRAREDRDDDGQAAGGHEEPATITAEQAAELRQLIQTHRRNEAKFLTWAKLQKLEDIPADRFYDARRAIQGA
ncbi:ERF family protein [Xanthobacter sediminis]